LSISELARSRFITGLKIAEDPPVIALDTIVTCLLPDRIAFYRRGCNLSAEI
jgi:hypothetical protein